MESQKNAAKQQALEPQALSWGDIAESLLEEPEHKCHEGIQDIFERCFNPLFDCITLAYNENDPDKQTFINLFEILAQNCQDAIKQRVSEMESLAGNIIFNVDEKTRGRSKIVGVMIGRDMDSQGGNLETETKNDEPKETYASVSICHPKRKQKEVTA